MGPASGVRRPGSGSSSQHLGQVRQVVRVQAEGDGGAACLPADTAGQQGEGLPARLQTQQGNRRRGCQPACRHQGNRGGRRAKHHLQR